MSKIALRVLYSPTQFGTLEAFFRGVVGLDSFGLDDDGRVGFLPVLGLGGDRPCDVAGCSAERYDR